MLITDLIQELQKLVDENKPYEDICGPEEIMIDIFGLNSEGNLVYKGFSKDIRITWSSDGVYPILTAFEP